MVKDELLTVAEVAAATKFNQRTVQRWINSGQLRAIRTGKGGHWRIPSDALTDFLLAWESNQPNT